MPGASYPSRKSSKCDSDPLPDDAWDDWGDNGGPALCSDNDKENLLFVPFFTTDRSSYLKFNILV